ncbi:MAG: NCS2 family permease [Peptoanaerobacter stomatis]|uniref:NCS2 family permease n=1 Tax=Peptoanaerobacter stomatis TaxID=796937 RepID=UPI003FA0C89D
MYDENGFLWKFFKLKENGTTVKTEVIAGFTTFVTLAYILAVNPGILEATGMDKGSVFTATVLASIIATVVMALYANYPFVLSAGMGLNAFFTYVVVLQMGHSWQFALSAVFIEGIIFLLLTFVKAREAIVNCIPLNLKSAVSVGIGLFIAFIGLKSAGIVVSDEATFVKLGNLTDPSAIVCIFGLFLCAFLIIWNVKGAILISVIASTLVGIPLGVTVLPESIIGMPPSVAPTAMAFTQITQEELLSFDMFFCVVTFLFVDMFDTIGMLVGTASKVGMLDEKGNLPKASQALTADAIGTTVGAMLGTSTITTFAESAAGISEGGRTGLTGMVTSILFAVSLFFAPLFTAIPSAATAPALIMVGLFMIENIVNVDFSSYDEAIPAFLTILIMPLTYSIGDGVMVGIMSYVICKILAKKFSEPSIVMYILTILFAGKIIFM